MPRLLTVRHTAHTQPFSPLSILFDAGTARREAQGRPGEALTCLDQGAGNCKARSVRPEFAQDGCLPPSPGTYAVLLQRAAALRDYGISVAFWAEPPARSAFRGAKPFLCCVPYGDMLALLLDVHAHACKALNWTARTHALLHDMISRHAKLQSLCHGRHPRKDKNRRPSTPCCGTCTGMSYTPPGTPTRLQPPVTPGHTQLPSPG